MISLTWRAKGLWVWGFFPCLQNITFTFLNSFGASADGDVLVAFTPKHNPISTLAYVASLVWPIQLYAFLAKFSLLLSGVCKDKDQAHCYFRRNAFFHPLCSKISLHSSMVFTTLFNQSIIQSTKSLQSSFSNTLSVAQHQQDEKAVWIFNLCITTHLSPFHSFFSFELKPLLCVLLIKQQTSMTYLASVSLEKFLLHVGFSTQKWNGSPGL